MEEYKKNKNNNAAYYFIDRHLDTEIENKKVFIEATSTSRSISYKELSIQTNNRISVPTQTVRFLPQEHQSC